MTFHIQLSIGHPTEEINEDSWDQLFSGIPELGKN